MGEAKQCEILTFFLLKDNKLMRVLSTYIVHCFIYFFGLLLSQTTVFFIIYGDLLKIFYEAFFFFFPSKVATFMTWLEK